MNQTITDTSNRIGESLIISIEGNIGAGKTTLLNLLEENLDNKVFEKKVEQVADWQNIDGNDVLAEFYNNTEKYSYLFQSLVFITRILDQSSPCKKNCRIIERCSFTDMIFAKNLYNEGKMNEVEYAVYKNWFTRGLLQFYKNAPNLILYLKTDPEQCYARKNIRNRDSEKDGISLQYLKDLDQLHDEWMSNEEYGVTEEGIVYLRLNGSCNFLKNEDEKVEIFDKIEQFLKNKYIDLYNGRTK